MNSDLMRAIQGCAKLIGLLLTAIPVFAGAEGVVPRLLLLNESPTDPYSSNVAAPFIGERDLYLWFPQDTDELTFGLEGTLELISVTPEMGWSNVGTVESPHLVFKGECYIWSGGPIARVSIRDATGAGGRICIVESTLDSRSCFGECHDDGEWYRLEGHGYSTDGGPQCTPIYSAECRPVSVESSSWGRTKALYR
jgi:hypothetical protein